MVEFQEPMNFGLGVATLQLKARGTGVMGSSPVTVQGGNSQTVQFSLLKVDSYEDYQSAFNFDAEASVIYGLFHASAKFKFAENHKYHSYSKYLVASIIVMNEFRQIPDPQLSEPAKELIRNGHTERFREEFGDSFVLGIKQGGEYYAVLEFTSETQEDLSSISAALEVGEFGLFSAAASFSSAVQRFKGQTSLKVNSFQRGGVDTTQTIDADGIIRKATQFPPEVKQSADNYLAFLQDYQALDLPEGPNLIDVENARLVLARFFPIRNALVRKLNDIDYILANPDQFENVEQFDLAQMESDVTNTLNDLTQNASECVNNPGDCRFKPLTLNPAGLALPKRKQSSPSPVAPPPPVDTFTIPDWHTTAEVDDLGGTLNLVIVGQVDHAQPEGVILSISPPAGTTVPITSNITITVVKNFAVDGSTGALIPL
jgi:hypothetical protein